MFIKFEEATFNLDAWKEASYISVNGFKQEIWQSQPNEVCQVEQIFNWQIPSPCGICIYCMFQI